MGYTFKENCTDIRNTKVKNIMRQLIKNGSKVDIFDNHADPKEFRKKNKKNLINNLKFIKKNYYHSIIIAVKHDSFKKIDINKIKSYGVKKALIYDLKNVFPKNNEILKL